MVVFWMEVFYKKGLDSISPANLAPDIDMPVLIIHGEKDQNFPLNHAWRLRDSFPAGRAELFVARDTDHSSLCGSSSATTLKASSLISPLAWAKERLKAVKA
jgi:dipeptidyl aminopeptidase/acylaminoacyl peptidase